MINPSFLSGYRDWGITALRVIIGIVFLAHGLQKLFMFGVEGVTGMLGGLGFPLPMVAAIVLIVVEALGGLALILGLFTRISALLLAITMLVAVVAVHLPGGFFAPEGVEFPLTLMFANITLLLTGSGALALDPLIEERLGSNSTQEATPQGA